MPTFRQYKNERYPYTANPNDGEWWEWDFIDHADATAKFHTQISHGLKVGDHFVIHAGGSVDAFEANSPLGTSWIASLEDEDAPGEAGGIFFIGRVLIYTYVGIKGPEYKKWLKTKPSLQVVKEDKVLVMFRTTANERDLAAGQYFSNLLTIGNDQDDEKE